MVRFLFLVLLRLLVLVLRTGAPARVGGCRSVLEPGSWSTPLVVRSFVVYVFCHRVPGPSRMPSRSRSCPTASVCAIPFSRRAPVATPGPRGPCLVIVPELVMSLAYVCMCMLRLQSLLPLSVPGIWFHHHHRPRTPSSTQDSRGGGRRRCFGRAAARPPHSLGYGCLGGSCDTLPLASLQRRPDKLQLTVGDRLGDEGEPTKLEN